jgi:predicted peroxiredoxin
MTDRIQSLFLIAVTGLALLLAVPAAADHPGRQGGHPERERGGQHMHQGGGHDHRLFVTVTGSATQDRAMPLVLANQAIDQGLEVRVLLCGDGAMLAVADYQAETFAPRDVSAQDLLKRLMGQGATVEVCAIFLPNTEFDESDLIEGIGIGQPGEVAAYMMGPRTRILSN